MGPVAPGDPIQLDQPEPGFVDQRSGVERVIDAFALESPVGDGVQVIVDQRQQPIESFPLAPGKLEQRLGDGETG